jgi:SAM-dependent methyltransferase
VPISLEECQCPVCAVDGEPARELADLFSGCPGKFSQKRCLECDTLFLSPRVAEAEVHHFYGGEYLGYEKAAESFADRIARHLEWDARRKHVLERYVNGGRILDVGSGNGFFLSLLDPAKWQLHAFDLERHVQYPFPHEFYAGRFDRGAAPVGNLDALTIWQTFGHLYNPRRALANAFEALRPKGVLLIALPDAASWERKLFGAAWAGWDAPRHVTSYSRAGLVKLLDRAGFRLLGIEADHYTGTTLALSVELALRSRGVRLAVHRSFAARGLLTPIASCAALLRQVPNLIYVAQKRG